MTTTPPNNTTNQTADAAVTPTQQPKAPETLGQFLVRLRQSRGLTQERVAEALQVQVRVVESVERCGPGQAVQPSLLLRLKRVMVYFRALTEREERILNAWLRECQRAADIGSFNRLQERAVAMTAQLQKMKRSITWGIMQAEGALREERISELCQLVHDATICDCDEVWDCDCEDAIPDLPARLKKAIDWTRDDVWAAMDLAFDLGVDACHRKRRGC